MALQSEIYEKYVLGAKLTDIDVVEGAKFWRELADQLIKCGPTFRLAFKEANECAMRLEDVRNARRLNNR